MILNKLSDEQLERLKSGKEQKIYDFLLASREIEKDDKYIYCLTLKTCEEIVAQFDTEVELKKDFGG